MRRDFQPARPPAAISGLKSAPGQRTEATVRFPRSIAPAAAELARLIAGVFFSGVARRHKAPAQKRDK